MNLRPPTRWWRPDPSGVINLLRWWKSMHPVPGTIDRPARNHERSPLFRDDAARRPGTVGTRSRRVVEANPGYFYSGRYLDGL